jgi:hypothetical protein
MGKKPNGQSLDMWRRRKAELDARRRAERLEVKRQAKRKRQAGETEGRWFWRVRKMDGAAA